MLGGVQIVMLEVWESGRVDAGRWALSPRFWWDSRVRGLSGIGRALLLYVLTGPFTSLEDGRRLVHPLVSRRDTLYGFGARDYSTAVAELVQSGLALVDDGCLVAECHSVASFFSREGSFGPDLGRESDLGEA